MAKKKATEIAMEVATDVETKIVTTTKSEKEELLELYQKLIDLKITRIADLENKIANCK